MSNPETVTAPGVVVHLSYDPSMPPIHPGSQWTRFVCLSDTHSNTFEVPYGDVLLHSGDLSSYGRVSQLKVTMDWLNQLPHATKIIIAGNHDFSLDEDWYECHWDGFHEIKEDAKLAKDLMIGERARGARIIYLDYSSVNVQAKESGRRWKVYGSPGSPWFGGWAFNYDRGGQAEDLHRHIPSDTDILLTHGPPHSVLDVVHKGDHVGCEHLLHRVEVIKPTLHLFGHIHEDRGAIVHEWNKGGSTTGTPRTVFVNAANTPSGRKALALRAQGTSLAVGGPGFQPIIVDFFDPMPDEVSAKDPSYHA